MWNQTGKKNWIFFIGLSCFLSVETACQSNNKQNKPKTQANKPAAAPAAKSGGPLNAKIGAVYAKEGKPGVFDVDIRVKEGVVKTGDKVDVVSADGKRFAFTVTHMRNPYEDIKMADKEAGTVYIILEGPADAKFDADFALVNPGGGAGVAPAVSTAKFNATINGKPWKGKDFPYSFSLFKKGVKNMAGNKPYLLLAFKSMDAVDDRQLTLMVFTADPKPGVYTKEKLEVLLTGSPTGNTKKTEMWGYKYPASATGGLQLEITSYQETGKGKARISGKLSGQFTKILGNGTMPVENGVFSELEIDVYDEQYLNKPQ
ncbi:MAG TPA: hypothetical protein PLL23_04845 [Chitinophagaceae bacterium]|nr:hypothetical protein [Chitinophagaceae bacterium]